MGANSFASGMRPINFPGLKNFMYSNNWMYEHKLSVAHTETFYTGPVKADGSIDLISGDKNFPGNIDSYRFSRTIYHDVPQTNNPAQMQEILNSAKNGRYSLITNNCQHSKQNEYLELGLAPQ